MFAIFLMVAIVCITVYDCWNRYLNHIEKMKELDKKKDQE